MSGFERIVFAGGGSGGHLFPGMAVAEEIHRRSPECEIVFVGSNRAIEQRIVRRTGFLHQTLSVESPSVIKRHPIRFLKTYWEAGALSKRLLKERSPQAVIGLGGFASVPVVRAAQKLGVPTILLEQNIVPGRATRWLEGRATLVCHAFEECRKQFPSTAKHVVTGNPVRTEIAEAAMRSTSERRPDIRTILILGGSQGARGVNRMWLDAADELAGELAPLQILHQTGEDDVEKVRARYRRLELSATAEAFFEVLPTLYRQADLAVSRAGATTLAELSCAGIPAVLIPYPNSMGDHQLKNAMFFESHGAARVVEQSSNPSESARTLAQVVREFLAADLAPLREAMLRLARPDAAKQVAERLFEVIHR